MIKHILVPLDGSRLAEAALPPAAQLAEALHANVTLIHIIEENAPQQVHGERHLTNSNEACAYLDKVAESAFPPDVHVEQHVHTIEEKNVANSIVDHINELSPDLIVMCSHGWGGLRDIIIGSLAQQVIGQGKTPVLLIHPKEQEEKGFTCMNVLVPLDGKPDHEQAIPVAADLVQACHGSLILISIVPTLGTLTGEKAATGRLMPVATSALLDIDRDNAVNYLREQVAKLDQSGLQVTTQVWRGDPASTIVEAAKRMHATLIVVGTHGKAGSDAFWTGSVAPKLTSLTNLPVMFVPVYTRIDDNE